MPYIAELNVYYFEKSHSDSNAPLLILLHGFTGSHQMFEHLIGDLGKNYHLIIPDLPGHGKSGLPENGEINLDFLLNVIQKLVEVHPHKKIFLLGYSLGGRLALQFAVNKSHLLSGLILESTTFGILDEIERQNRIQADQALAKKIETDYKGFLNDWDKNPVFYSETIVSEVLTSRMKEIRSNQNPSGLSAMLKGFGTGVMDPCFDKLSEISCEVLILTGETDSKFTNIGMSIKQHVRKSQHVIVPQCGHRIHLEDSDAYLRTINTFILNNYRTV